MAGAVGAAALLWAAPAQGAPTITSVETIHPYVLEVTLSEAIGPHGGREDAITVTVNGTDYPVWTATPMCAEKDKYGNCPGGFRWVWAVIGWPIFRNDTVRLSYSREAANRPLRNGSGYVPSVSNLAVTVDDSAAETKPTITLETTNFSPMTVRIDDDEQNLDFKFVSTLNTDDTLYPGTGNVTSAGAGTHRVALGDVGVPVFWGHRWYRNKADRWGRRRLTKNSRGSDGKWSAKIVTPAADLDDGPIRVTLRPGSAYSRGSATENPPWRHREFCARLRFDLQFSTGCLGTSFQVGTDPLTAGFDDVPTAHDGSTPFTFEVEFSEATAATATQVQNAVGVTGGAVTAAALESGSDTVWEVTVTPSSTSTLTLTLGVTEDCTATGAICTSDGRKLSNAIAQQVAFSPSLSVADAEATEGDDASLDFAVTLTPAASSGVTVQYATSNGTATAGDDYTETSGTLTFAANETAKTVSVPIIDDEVDDDGETLTLTLSNPTGAVLDDATATGTIRNTETTTTVAALTASFQDMPSEHDGGNTSFTFGLEFSEDVDGLGYATLRDDAFDVTGGEVTTAKRKHPPDRNDLWTIHVEPDGREAVTISLPAGSVTTSDNRSLQSGVTATVAGPPATPLTASFENVPASHAGSGSFTFDLEFSEDVEGLSYATLQDEAEAPAGQERPLDDPCRA